MARFFKVRFAVLAWLFVLGLASAGHAHASGSGPLKAGAAKVDITPAADELPRQYLGVLDPIYSRAIVLDNGRTSVALVTVDVLFMPNPMTDRLKRRISAELGIAPNNIMLAGTGTHSVPMGRDGEAPGPNMTIEPGISIDDEIVESVRLAKANLQPARMSFGTGMSHINIQRDRIDPKTGRWWEGPNYEGPSDKTVAAIHFTSPSGEPIAVYYNYAVFNVITGTLDLVSGDITGAASRYIEESLGDKAVALLSLGAHGDQNPLYFQQTFELREIRIKDFARRGEDIANAMPPPGGVGLDRQDPTVARVMNQQKQMILSMGQFLGEEVLRIGRDADRAQTDVQLYADQKTVSCPGRERTNTGRAGYPGTYKDADPVEIRLGLLMIGDVAVGSINGIPYNAIGVRLKRESPYARTMLATRVNGMSNAGYIPDDASFGHNTFQVLSSRLKPGCAENAIVGGIIGMMPRIAY